MSSEFLGANLVPYICARKIEDQKLAQKLSEKLNCAVCEEAEYPYFLIEDAVLSLNFVSESGKTQYAVDVKTQANHDDHKNLLHRLLKKTPSTIVDLYAGFCQDAMFFFRHGKKLIAFERNPYVHAMSENALSRAAISEDDFRLTQAAWQESSISIDDNICVYIDPMFEQTMMHRAQPKKHAQALRYLTQDDVLTNLDELDSIVHRFSQCTRIVKLPVHAPVIAKPSTSIHGKSIRFDVYYTCM
jgi:16S rRNA (guanine1516-N2)-methyltransferase